MLIVFAGLPGVGKTSIARELARRSAVVYLRIDSIEQAMTNSSICIHPTEDAGYMAGYAVAEDNLRIGRTVIADSFNPVEASRNAWLDVAKRAGCEAFEVEVICSDPIEHRKRIDARVSDIPGLTMPSWQDVLSRKYQSWPRDHLVIDTAGISAEQCITELLALLPGILANGSSQIRDA